jgi:hypothetical protein
VVVDSALRNIQAVGAGSEVYYWFPATGFLSRYSVFRVNFMVKLLRACVWMPWHK